ncbi:AAA family ATPase [Pseudofrankia sp. DC12]|uniref:AAA family ATPase n=1 Tax=Pseudofrankia sp. DC12 TaxID=683315 RepID=UPI0005F76FAA|nr:AAA family ATPase [Pseudofrankia sp. DC12]
MYLKSLTLRGFKSFASSTTLRLEPGITCVVGPNGSGKSNVVDAMAWVLGEQGAKALRGGTMSDVIFAGTPSRPALGRAEVLLTIDNSDGALPIAYSEVTVGRLMFRSGQSEYTINGTSCRLLDIQELMSDSGIGRELHVIVGQGQLDAVLHASPEERRAFIEEAAGVLKHRKRKEKALRKLEAMAANLTRLSDLSAELRRQLGPLGRQAEIARKAGAIQASLRDARLRLLADDLVTARVELAADIADEETVRAKLTETEGAHAAAVEREGALEQELARLVPRAAAAQETWYALSGVRERLRGTGQLASERARLLRAGAQAARGGRDPEELEQEAAAVREREAALLVRLDRDRDTQADVIDRRAELERALAAEEQALLAASRAAAARREGIARLAGKVEAARSRAGSAEADIVRLTEALDAAQARDAEASGSRTALDTELARIEAEREELAERHESAVVLHTAANERLEALRSAERAADRDRASAAARREALSLSLSPADGAAALLTATSGPGAAEGPEGSGPDKAASGKPGSGGKAAKGKVVAPAPAPPDTPIQVVGRLATILAVTPGAEVAIAAALGQAADALAVGSVDDVVTALRWLRSAEAGRAAFVPASPAPPAPSRPTELPSGAVAALDLVRVVDERFAPAVAAILGAVVVVDDLSDAAKLAGLRPALAMVTRDGDVLGPPAAIGGSAHAPSLLELAAAADEAAGAMDTAAARADAARGAMEPAREEVARTRAAIDAASSGRSAANARHRALAEQLAQLDRGRGSVAGEISRLERNRLAAEAARDQAYGALGELEAQLSASDDEPDGEDRPADERDRLVAATAAVRGEEVEARLAVRTAEERARGLAGRADALVRQAGQERAARAAAARTRALREQQAKIASSVAEVAQDALAACETSLAGAAAERERTDAARRATDTELSGVRDRVRAYATALAALRDEAHRDELAREAKRLRSEALEAKALEEHGIAADDLVAEYGPELPVPPDEEGGAQRPYDRAEQSARLATAEKQLTRLGRINPLALEEFEALQERAAFLSAQLDDIKNTRRDLLLVVDEVDSRVREVFAAAFHDTAREFEVVFDTLFPGGEGRLVLTDPEDMLATGIEVEARPPGKKVKRLSLLSGGERSLTALALLLAIFRARPSPFYVLDEVEAALDDRNLGRLLNAVEGLRQKSQLIIITHQKRTMEIADALYGVSMRGDGVTTVISQRLRERASA